MRDLKTHHVEKKTKTRIERAKRAILVGIFWHESHECVTSVIWILTSVTLLSIAKKK